MNPIIQGEVTLAFVMGGISAKTKKPYIQVSNGLSAFFLTIGKGVEIDENTFSQFREGDEINLIVSQRVGSTRVTLEGLETEID